MPPKTKRTRQRDPVIRESQSRIIVRSDNLSTPATRSSVAHKRRCTIQNKHTRNETVSGLQQEQFSENGDPQQPISGMPSTQSSTTSLNRPLQQRIPAHSTEHSALQANARSPTTDDQAIVARYSSNGQSLLDHEPFHDLLQDLHDEFPIEGTIQSGSNTECSQFTPIMDAQARLYEASSSSAPSTIEHASPGARTEVQREADELFDDMYLPADDSTATNHRPVIIPNQTSITISFPPDDTRIWDDFADEVTRYTYTEDAFPEDYLTVCDDIARKMAQIPDNDPKHYSADGKIRRLYRKVLTARRTSAHSQVNTFLLRYNFGPEMFPPQYRNVGPRKKYLYLLDLSRFARAGYGDHGAMMQSPFLSYMIFKVFFNKKGRGGPRIIPTPERTPPALIALTYTAIYFHMAEHSQHVYYAGDDEKFQEDSIWCKTYLDYLYQRIPNAQTFDWNEVSQYHGTAIRALQNRNQNNEWDSGMMFTSEMRLYDAVDDNEPLV
ncbi:hypothetical protein BJV82DRAFT_674972 [Fennellomyces sp. T-0311]|nr:hypothetical protein BJV82DRAFT_674972 [Fennellomyces sp. T-0311]